MNNKCTYSNAKVDRICEMLGKVIAYLIVITMCIGICYGGAWLAIKIYRCIENLLYAILFFAAVALGG